MIEKSLDEFEKLPFSHYKTWRLKDSNSTQRVLYFYHSSPLHQLDIHHIPISGVKVLVSMHCWLHLTHTHTHTTHTHINFLLSATLC